MSIADQYYQTQDLIDKTLSFTSRNRSDIELIAVSKKQSQDSIMELVNCGHKSFGENQIQEIELKWMTIKEKFPDVQLSFIGSIQSLSLIHI